MTDTLSPPKQRTTAGPWSHRGRLRVSMQLSNGQVVTINLPEDWQALLARVSALEAAAGTGIDALEDLKYGN